MRDDPPGINRYERDQARPTCDYAWMGDDGPIYCLAPADFGVRWRWATPQPHPIGGHMCEAHIITACEQLAQDPDVVYASIQLIRYGEEVE